MNHSNPACFIKSCGQTACYVFDSISYDELNTFWIVTKIYFRLLNNEEQLLQKICFCKAHYDQVLLISQCELCGNRSMDMVALQEDNVRECQLILREDNIPVTIKYGNLICKLCNFYILLRCDRTITITCELQKHIDAAITRIKNKNISNTNGLERIQLAKNKINMKKKEENNQFLMVIFLPKNINNFFNADSSMPSQLESSVFKLDAIRTPPLLISSEVVKIMESLTVSITMSIGTGLMTGKLLAALTEGEWDVKFTVENPTVLILSRKKKPTFLNENSSVPRTKKPKILGVLPTTPVDKSTIADHKPLFNDPLVFNRALKSYDLDPNKHTKTPESISPIKKPTHMPRIQLLQNTFDSQSMPPSNEFPKFSRQRAGLTTFSPTTSGKKQSFEIPNISVEKPTIADRKPLYNKPLVFTMNQTRSTSSRTEFPELSSQRAGPTTMSSTIPNMIQLFENLKNPYSNGTDFINHLINLETCRCLGNLTVGNNKTTHRQQTSNTVTTSPHIIHCSPEQTISHADDDQTDLPNHD